MVTITPKSGGLPIGQDLRFACEWWFSRLHEIDCGVKSVSAIVESSKQRPNNVRKIRESKMMSKAELARKTGLSVQTIDRVEKGHFCRLDTKRKILIALGLDLDHREEIFLED